MAKRGALVGVLAVGLVGCVAPSLTRDGQLVWAPGAERGASILTANGVEFLDRADRPQPVVRSSPYEPYRPATGFVVPADGRWHRTAQAVTFRSERLGVTVRSSDALVPAWGGEVLLSVELSSLGVAGGTTVRRGVDRSTLGALPPERARGEELLRAPLRLMLVVDDVSERTAGLVCAALESLSGGDEVAIVDTRGPRVVVPFVSYGQRSLLEGALRRRVATHPKGTAGRDLPGALTLARDWFVREPDAEATPEVLVVTDGATLERDGEAVPGRVQALVAAGVRVAAAGSAELVDRRQMQVFEEGEEAAEASSRRAALDRVLPSPLLPSLRDLTLSVASSPAPSPVIEATGGQASASLDEALVYFEKLSGGEARTEMLRVSVPPFVAGETFRLTLRVEGRDATTGAPVSASHRLALRYTDDVEALARERSGDVIADAAALTMVRKLDRGMFGEAAGQPEGMRRLVAWQREALGRLSQDTGDASLTRRARLLEALAWSLEAGGT